MSFIERHSQEIIQYDLRQNLLLHLFNLWDFSLVSSSHILACMESFDAIAYSSQYNGSANDLSSIGGESYNQGLKDSAAMNTSSVMNATKLIKLPFNGSGSKISSNAGKVGNSSIKLI